MRPAYISNNKGFTLVELMVATTIALILMVTIYASYTLQKKSQTAQSQISEMQQNIRASLVWLQHDIRMAGYDKDPVTYDKSCSAPGSGVNTVPGIHTATATEFGFSMDLDNDGTCNESNENITFNLFTSDVDNIQKLSRKNPDTNNALTQSIEAIEFFYTLKDGSQTLAPSAAEIDSIKSVKVSILARTEQRDASYDNSAVTYVPASGAAQTWGPYGDKIHRTLLITDITFRNIYGIL